jgi:hypothetical protein
MTSGAAGQMYGNGYTWPFLAGWRDHLDTPGAAQMNILRSFFEPRAWYALVPDVAHTVVTSGYGTYASTGYVASNDFLTAARTADGTLVVAYTPVLRTFTVDMSKLSAAAVARWFDPSTGAYTAIAGSPLANSGVQSFTPPALNGDGDGGWVLVLETNPVGITTDTSADTPRSIALSAGIPNPFRESALFGVTLSSSAAIDLGVYDASGRLVRTLARATFPAGRREIEWDGADSSGRAVRPGRYFVRLRVGETVRSVAVVRLR